MKIRVLIILITTITTTSLAQKTNQNWNISATHKFLRKDFEGALVEYNKCIELNPKVGYNYLNRGNKHFRWSSTYCWLIQGWR